jgi:hypothetical protein
VALGKRLGVGEVGLGLVDHYNRHSSGFKFKTAMSFHHDVPRKAILSPEQLAYFQTSKTHKNVVSYIESLNNAVVGVKLTDECSESPV